MRWEKAKSEHEIQAEIVKTAREYALLHPELSLLHAIPNGGQRSVITGARLKAEGVLVGIPDLCLPVPRGGSGALYLEVKTEKGKLSPAQNEMTTRLIEAGNAVHVVRSAEEAIGALLLYLGGGG